MYVRRIKSRPSMIGIHTVETLLKSILCRVPSVDTRKIFPAFMDACTNYSPHANKHAATLTDLRASHNQNVQGTLFEYFCLMYLTRVRKYPSVWMLCDVPQDILSAHHMSTHDLGIDLVALAPDGSHHAIQCKFRSRRPVTWRDLSTFYSLCGVTGSWGKCIVMTSAPYIRRVGKRPVHHTSICKATFDGIPRAHWYALAGFDSNQEPNQVIAAKNDELRARREKFLQSLEHMEK